jgi:multidrug resistance efflux pump
MENISNEKIEKARADLAKSKTDLAKSKARTAEIQAKIREQEKQLEMLEAFEIAARYRELIGNEDFAAQLKANHNQPAPTFTANGAAEKEDEFNVNLKTE